MTEEAVPARKLGTRTPGRGLDEAFEEDDELAVRMADDGQPVPATWRTRIRVLWEAHQDRVRRQAIVGEWRRGAIQVLTTTAGVLAFAKLAHELFKQWTVP